MFCRAVVSCNSGMEKYGVLHFGGIERLECRAISASAELIVASVNAIVRRHSVQSADSVAACCCRHMVEVGAERFTAMRSGSN